MDLEKLKAAGRVLRRTCRICAEPIWYVALPNDQYALESCSCRPSRRRQLVPQDRGRMQLMLLQVT